MNAKSKIIFFRLDFGKTVFYLNNLIHSHSEFHSVRSFCKFNNDLINKYTYSYNSDLININNIQYGFLYCKEYNIEKICPKIIQSRFTEMKNKIYKILKSLQFLKINIEDHSLTELIPEEILQEYFKLKTEICRYVFNNYPKPKNYEFLVKLIKTLDLLSRNKLNLNKEKLVNKFQNDPKGKSIIKNYENYDLNLKYNIFSTVTGRLGLFPGCFPVMNLKKEIREIIEPNNDFFIEIDYNGMDIRSIFALLGKEQPEEDIHLWNLKNIFQNSFSRKKSKTMFFSWMFGSNSPELKQYSDSLDKIYDKKKLLDKFYLDGKIHNLYGREISVEPEKALSYLIQSTSTDIVLRKMIEISEFLRERKSFLSLSIHDSFLLDMSNEDKDIIPSLVNIAKNTDFGEFKVKVSTGKNFGEMVEL